MSPAPADRFAALADLTALLGQRDTRLLADLQAQLEPASGLHCTAIAALAVHFGRGWSPARLRRMRALLGQRLPVGQVTVIAPANLFVASWQAALEPWLAGNEVRVRTSRRDGGALPWLGKQLHDRIGPAAGLQLWPPQRDAANHPVLEPELVRDSHTLAVWGSEQTIASIEQLAKRADFSGQLRLHGHHNAVAVVDCRNGRRPSDKPLAGLATDIVIGDGRGCMSLGQIGWFGAQAADLQVLHVALAQAVAVAAVQFPAGPDHANAAVLRNLQTQSMAVVAAVHPQMWFTARPCGWLYSHAQTDPIVARWPLPGRCASSTIVNDQMGLAALRPRLMGPISAVCSDLPPAELPKLALALATSRWCRPGHLQAVSADQGHDNYQVFEGFVQP